MALAVGIILGAGPLQASLGNLLSNQVSSLRASLAEQRQIVEILQNDQQASSEYVSKTQDMVLSNKLSKSVALVTIPGADEAAVNGIKKAVAKAGGKITALVELTEKSFVKDNFAYRKAISGQLSSYLGAQEQDSNADIVLGMAIGKSINSKDNNSKSISELLVAKDEALVKYKEAPNATSQGIIVIGRNSLINNTQPAVADEKVDAETMASQVNLVRGLLKTQPTVVVGASTAKADLVHAIRDDSKAKITTIDGLGSSIAEVSTVLALLESFNGQNGNTYGVGYLAKQKIPNFTLPNAVPSAVPSGNN